MIVVETGKTGIPLRKIIEKLGNKSYPYIECRCKWIENDIEHDEFWGTCSYDNKTGILTSLDGDSYSLEDLYFEWKEWLDITDNKISCLTVWEKGETNTDAD